MFPDGNHGPGVMGRVEMKVRLSRTYSPLPGHCWLPIWHTNFSDFPGLSFEDAVANFSWEELCELIEHLGLFVHQNLSVAQLVDRLNLYIQRHRRDHEERRRGYLDRLLE